MQYFHYLDNTLQYNFILGNNNRFGIILSNSTIDTSDESSLNAVPTDNLCTSNKVPSRFTINVQASSKEYVFTSEKWQKILSYDLNFDKKLLEILIQATKANDLIFTSDS